MSDDPRDRYEVVIGLEVHTHLATASKLFSPAPVAYGDPPNHDVHPIDLALPGVLPVLNEGVIDLAIRFGLAIQGTVNTRSIFARKNYFYPDLPKGYQISQFEEPVVSGGFVDIEVEGADGKPVAKRIQVTRAHLEEDAGKSIHDPAVAGGDDSLVDLNRAGVPLLEIVSEPELRSADEAVAYLRALREIVRAVGVSHGDMEKGQFRCDANVSLRPRGSERFGTRTETKNINSFQFVHAAIEAEVLRQAELLEDGGEVVQATMTYDPASGRTRVLRLKENSDDYRYFPDPDLIPLAISEERIEKVRAAMPELPADRRVRFEAQYELPAADARLLAGSAALAAFFEAAVKASGGAVRAVGKWVLQDLMRELNEQGLELDACRLEPAALARLIALVDEGRLTTKSAQQLFPELVAEGGDPEALMTEGGLEAVSDTGVIEAAVDAVLAENPDVVEAVRGGDGKRLNFLMGQVMKQTQGKADPGQVRELLAAKIG